MIRFDREAWTTCFYWHGGIIKEVAQPSLIYLVYVASLYLIQLVTGFPEAVAVQGSSLKALVSFLVFLLVFRVNQVSTRHRQGAAAFEDIFGTLGSLLTTTLCNMHGAKPDLDAAATQLHTELTIASKINVVRLSMAFAVSLVIHCNLLDSMENQGDLDEESLHEVIFLHHRLQQLLYVEEMDVLDQALSVSYEAEEAQEPPSGPLNALIARLRPLFFAEDEPGPAFRAEVARHRRVEEFHGEPLLGRCGARKARWSNAASTDGNLAADPDAREGVVIAPLPKVVLTMLIGALRVPLCQPWGYPERMLNVHVGAASRLCDLLADIASICTMPTPLPYIQLSHVLIFTFGILYPLSIDFRLGLADNVMIPFMIFFVIQGFEHLAKMMETPTGHDSTDLNFIEMIHNLEVHAKYVFDITERDKEQLNNALFKTLKSFNFANAASSPASLLTGKVEKLRPAETEVASPSADFPLPPRHFEHYFRWVPIPTLLLEDLMRAHGHVDILGQCDHSSDTSLRQLLRKSFQRRHQGQVYEAVSADSEKEARHVLEAIRRDPYVFCFYLAYNGIHEHAPGSEAVPEVSEEYRRHQQWRCRTGRLLEKHSGFSLLEAAGGNDTERSVMGFAKQTPLLHAATPPGATPHPRKGAGQLL